MPWDTDRGPRPARARTAPDREKLTPPGPLNLLDRICEFRPILVQVVE